MSDRFKFRFWFYNNAYKKWYCINSDFITTDGSAIPYDDGEGGASTDYDRDYIVEQCTGLKDKNGKLIYEGDIVKTHLKRKGVVLWNETCWCYRTLDKVSCTYIMESYDIEIIGNVHENADLLENEE